MNDSTQACSPELSGSHPSRPTRSAVATRLRSSAAIMYCSTRDGLTVSAAAAFVNPFWATSAVKLFAGAVVSPSRSATVLSYSMWVSRRTRAGVGSSGRLTGAPPAVVPAPPVLDPPDPVTAPGPAPAPFDGPAGPPVALVPVVLPLSSP